MKTALIDESVTALYLLHDTTTTVTVHTKKKIAFVLFQLFTKYVSKHFLLILKFKSLGVTLGMFKQKTFPSAYHMHQPHCLPTHSKKQRGKERLKNTNN